MKMKKATMLSILALLLTLYPSEGMWLENVFNLPRRSDLKGWRTPPEKFFDKTSTSPIKISQDTITRLTYCRGIANIGNHCYANATLQFLCSWPEFVEYIVNYKGNDEFTKAVGECVCSLTDATNSCLSYAEANNVYKKLEDAWNKKYSKSASIISKVGTRFSQEDAHEFLIPILDNIDGFPKECYYLNEFMTKTQENIKTKEKTQSTTPNKMVVCGISFDKAHAIYDKNETNLDLSATINSFVNPTKERFTQFRVNMMPSGGDNITYISNGKGGYTEIRSQENLQLDGNELKIIATEKERKDIGTAQRVYSQCEPRELDLRTMQALKKIMNSGMDDIQKRSAMIVLFSNRARFKENLTEKEKSLSEDEVQKINSLLPSYHQIIAYSFETTRKFDKLPQTLIIHLKRFETDDFGYPKSKIEIPVVVSENLSLQDPNDNKKWINYELLASINHSGSLSYGHYWCTNKRGDKWYKADDSLVSSSDPKNIDSVNTYILMYRQKTE